MSKAFVAALAAFSVAAAAFAEAADGLANAFPSGSEQGEDEGGSSKAAGSKSRGGSSTKVAAGKKSSKPAPKDDDGVDEDTLREKLTELVEAKGADALVEAFSEVGAGALKDVDESQYQELFDIAQARIDAEDDDEEEEPPAKPAKKTAAKKTPAKKAVTLAQITAAAKKVDKASRAKVYKKLGITTVDDLEEDDYQTAYDALVAAAPEEDDDAV